MSDALIPDQVQRRIAAEAIVDRELAESIRSAVENMPAGHDLDAVVEDLVRAARRAIEVPMVQRTLMELYNPIPAEFLGANRPRLNGNAEGGGA